MMMMKSEHKEQGSSVPKFLRKTFEMLEVSMPLSNSTIILYECYRKTYILMFLPGAMMVVLLLLKTLDYSPKRSSLNASSITTLLHTLDR